MKVDKIIALVLVGWTTISTSTSTATETYRKLAHHEGKDSKSGKTSKSSKKGDNSSMEHPSYFSMSVDIPDASIDVDTVYSGKGKGSKSPKSSKSAKSSKKGSTKSEKKSTGGKGKDDETHSPTMHPTPSPASASASADQAERPPSSVPPAPTTASPSSPVNDPATPEDPSLQEVRLERYTISYTLSESVMPMREDYLELEALTNTYFNDYMQDVFEEPSMNSLVEFRTTLHTSEYRFGEPVIIFYDSVAYFTEDFPSSRLPAPSTLETLLQLELEDSSAYIDELINLGVENAFSFTTVVGFNAAETTGTSRTSQSGKSNSGASPFAIAASAVGAVLLVAGIVLYRRRTAESEEDYYMSKNLNKNSGDRTVAGETYAGYTYDGTVSVAPSSHVSSQDEERGLVDVDLNETEGEDAWDGLSTTAPNRLDSHDDGNDSDHEEATISSSHSKHDIDSFVSAEGHRSLALSMDESSTIHDRADPSSNSRGLHPDPSSDSISLNSFNEDDAIAEDTEENARLSVEEIEAMLVLNQ